MTETLKVLICGGGCAGPSLAFWLARAGHHVTIVERYPALRASGAQIDIRAQGIQVIKKMGLLETIRAKTVGEDGVQFLNPEGKARATIQANKSGKGAQSLTSEYEIMRGDLVRILYDATKDLPNVRYIFGMTVESFEQDDNSVTAHFSNGTTDTFDILVGADGQGSRIRKAIQPADSPDPIRHLGSYTAYWTLPRDTTDVTYARIYATPRRWVMSRTHSPDEIQAYFSLREDNDELRNIPRASVETQKEYWTRKFAHNGWQTQRFLDALQTTDNFYCSEIVQVHTQTWSKGRVVLLADAAHCPSPASGMGTTSAFVGAYVLAGEICRHQNQTQNQNNHDLSAAFANYDSVLRPFVKEIQKLYPWLFPLIQPGNWFMIKVFYTVLAAVTWLRIPELATRFSSPDKGGWKLPDYPELDAVVDGGEKEQKA